jgi:hypothetical protein
MLMNWGDQSVDYPRARRPVVRVVNAQDHHQRWLSDAAKGVVEGENVMLTHTVTGKVALGWSKQSATRRTDTHRIELIGSRGRQ